jgi:hypothetical protein
LFSTRHQQQAESVPCNLQVLAWRLAGPLLERVENVHGFPQLGDVEDSMLSTDHSSGLHVELPETGAFLSAGLNKAGTSDAIKKAEG